VLDHWEYSNWPIDVLIQYAEILEKVAFTIKILELQVDGKRWVLDSKKKVLLSSALQ
jgi:hypothetical protein